MAAGKTPEELGEYMMKLQKEIKEKEWAADDLADEIRDKEAEIEEKYQRRKREQEEKLEKLRKEEKKKPAPPPTLAANP